MIRNASLEDASTLTDIARDAERYWGYPENWIKHWESDLTISPELIRDNHVYVDEEDGEIRGFYALRGTGDLEHLCVKPEMIGTGIGKDLLLDAMDRTQKAHKSHKSDL